MPKLRQESVLAALHPYDTFLVSGFASPSIIAAAYAYQFGAPLVT
jgi:hypothetical protein